MSFDRHAYYDAHCDVRLDRHSYEPLDPQPTPETWRAWSDAGSPGPETGRPEWDAIGQPCRERSKHIEAPSAAEARRKMQADEWRFKPGGVHARGIWRAACPKHREHL